MKITQLRNATMILHFKDQVILVDPMFAPMGAIPALKYATKNRRRNPLVELPEVTDGLLNQVTHCLITHCQKGHFDHLDRAGAKWLRDNNIPILCSEVDTQYLTKKGLNVTPLKRHNQNEILGGIIDLIPCVHGEGFIGKFMAHGVGFLIKLPHEPSVYIAGDTILTKQVRDCIRQHQPDVIVVPAGGAQFDLGSELIMDGAQAIEVGHLARGKVVANHLEALDHCPISRDEILQQVNQLNWQQRFFVPNDGETLSF